MQNFVYGKWVQLKLMVYLAKNDENVNNLYNI